MTVVTQQQKMESQVSGCGRIRLVNAYWILPTSGFTCCLTLDLSQPAKGFGLIELLGLWRKPPRMGSPQRLAD